MTDRKSFVGLLKMKAGCFGEGIVVSQLSMRRIANMVGRSVASSCTHMSPIWMHLKTSWGTNDSIIDESTISKALFSLQSSQTCMVYSIIQKGLYYYCKWKRLLFFCYLHALLKLGKSLLDKNYYSSCH